VKVEFAPNFLKGENGKTILRQVKLGEKINLNCETKANPKGTVKWFFGKSESHLQPLTLTDDRLKIEKFSLANHGLYECVVENSVGRVNKFFNVNQQPKSK
jgi:Immunoglobulin I-set domain